MERFVSLRWPLGASRLKVAEVPDVAEIIFGLLAVTPLLFFGARLLHRLPAGSTSAQLVCDSRPGRPIPIYRGQAGLTSPQSLASDKANSILEVTALLYPIGSTLLLLGTMESGWAAIHYVFFVFVVAMLSTVTVLAIRSGGGRFHWGAIAWFAVRDHGRDRPISPLDDH